MAIEGPTSRREDTRERISESSLRHLGNTISSLASNIKELSATTAKKTVGGVMSGVKSVGGTLHENFSPSTSSQVGVVAASAINPFVGELVRQVLDKNRGVLGSTIHSMASGTKEMFSNMKAQMSERKTSRATTQQLQSLEKARSVKAEMRSQSGSGIFESTGRTNRKRAHRIINNSYTRMYGSENDIEAIDRLRISNAQWLKALGTMSKSELRSQKLPRAERGGYVKRTGSAIVHAGETIVPGAILQAQSLYLRDIRDSLANQSTLLNSISKNQEELTDFSREKVHPLDTLIEKTIGSIPIVGGMLQILPSFWYEKFKWRAISGPAQRYARLVVRNNNAFGTIAAATVQTYAQARADMVILHSQMESLISAVGGQSVYKGAGAALKKQNTLLSAKDKFTNFLLTGDIMDLIFDPTQLDSKEGLAENRRSFSNPMYRGKSKRQMEKEGETPGLLKTIDLAIMGTPEGDARFPKRQGLVGKISGKLGSAATGVTGEAQAIRQVSEADPAQGMIIRVLTQVKGGINKIFKLNKESEKHTILDDRGEVQYQKTAMEWFRKNRFGSAVGSLLGGMKSLFFALLGPGGLLASMLGGLLGMVGINTKSVGMLGGFARALSGETKVGSMAGAVKGLRGGKIFSSIFKGGAKTAKVAGNVAAKGGSIAAKSFGFAGKVAGKLALPITIAMAIYDGITGWFKAGKVFDTKNPTIKQKFSTMLGNVVDGLWDIIRIPFNLINKYILGNDFQLGSILEPVSKTIHAVINILSPILTNTYNFSKWLGNMYKTNLKFLSDIVMFIPRLFYAPRDAFEKLGSSISDVFHNWVIEFPKMLWGTATSLFESFYKLGEYMHDDVFPLIERGLGHVIISLTEELPVVLGELNTKLGDWLVEDGFPLLWKGLKALIWDVPFWLGDKIVTVGLPLLWKGLKALIWDVPFWLGDKIMQWATKVGEAFSGWLFDTVLAGIPGLWDKYFTKPMERMASYVSVIFVDPMMDLFKSISAVIGSVQAYVFNWLRDMGLDKVADHLEAKLVGKTKQTRNPIDTNKVVSQKAKSAVASESKRNGWLKMLANSVVPGSGLGVQALTNLTNNNTQSSSNSNINTINHNNPVHDPFYVQMDALLKGDSL